MKFRENPDVKIKSTEGARSVDPLYTGNMSVGCCDVDGWHSSSWLLFFLGIPY